MLPGQTILELERLNLTRYSIAVVTILVFYDHFLTFHDEYRYIWRARSSFEKWGFLINRYVLPMMLVVINHEFCVFNGIKLSPLGCRQLLTSMSMVSTLFPAATNMLVLLRVLVLWRDEKRIKILLYTVYTVTVTIAVLIPVITCIEVWRWTVWDTTLNSCLSNFPYNQVPFYVMWVAPSFFELTVVACVIFNTIASPRSANVPLTRALRNNGIIFFVSVAMLRITNMLVTTHGSYTRQVINVYILWAFISIILNRSILNLRKVECEEDNYDFDMEGLLMDRSKSRFSTRSDTESSSASQSASQLSQMEG